jgi:hypothetical protein
MQSGQLNKAGRLVLAFLAVFVLGAFTAAAAQAVEAPRWSVASKILGAGETHYLTAKIYTTVESPTFKLAAGTGATQKVITCGAVRLKEGVIIGSSAGTAGKGSGVIEIFGNCSVTGNGSACKVVEPIVTNPLKVELVETEKATGTSGSLLMLFEPVVPPSFLIIKFTGTCTVTETTVSGKVAGQVRKDPENGMLGELIELGKTAAEARSGLINFPSTPIEKVTKFSSGATSEAKVELTTFDEACTLQGVALVLLAKKEGNGEFVSDGTLWSAQP